MGVREGGSAQLPGSDVRVSKSGVQEFSATATANASSSLRRPEPTNACATQQSEPRLPLSDSRQSVADERTPCATPGLSLVALRRAQRRLSPATVFVEERSLNSSAVATHYRWCYCLQR